MTDYSNQTDVEELRSMNELLIELNEDYKREITDLKRRVNITGLMSDPQYDYIKTLQDELELLSTHSHCLPMKEIEVPDQPEYYTIRRSDALVFYKSGPNMQGPNERYHLLLRTPDQTYRMSTEASSLVEMTPIMFDRIFDQMVRALKEDVMREHNITNVNKSFYRPLIQ